MKRSTFEKRTSAFNKNTNGYRYAEMILTGTGLYSWEKTNKFRTVKVYGTGRGTHYANFTYETEKVLIAAGLSEYRDYTIGNDAPRGGLHGTFIQLTSNGRRKMIKEDPVS